MEAERNKEIGKIKRQAELVVSDVQPKSIDSENLAGSQMSDLVNQFKNVTQTLSFDKEEVLAIQTELLQLKNLPPLGEILEQYGESGTAAGTFTFQDELKKMLANSKK